MYKYKLATSGQRFLAFIIDFLLISIIASIISSLIFLIIKFDTSVVSLKNYLDIMNRYMEAVASNNLDFENIAEELINFSANMVLYTFVNAISDLIVCIIYLVVIPKLCSFQTLGRLAARCKVVNRDNDKPSTTNYILREIVGFFLFYRYIGFILIIVSGIVANSSGYSLIDKISKTKLVSTKDVEIVEEEDNTIDADINEEESNDVDYKVF